MPGRWVRGAAGKLRRRRAPRRTGVRAMPEHTVRKQAYPTAPMTDLSTRADAGFRARGFGAELWGALGGA